MTLATLTESQVAARFCINEKKTARKLAEELMYLHEHAMGLLSEKIAEKSAAEVNFCLRVTVSLDAIRGILNFSRASDHFRRILQEIDNFFPALEKLLVTVHDLAESIPADHILRAMVYCMRLIHTFIVIEDSQQWALDKGFFRIQAAGARLALLDIFPNNINNSPMLKFGRSMIDEMVCRTFRSSTS